MGNQQTRFDLRAKELKELQEVTKCAVAGSSSLRSYREGDLHVVRRIQEH